MVPTGFVYLNFIRVQFVDDNHSEPPAVHNEPPAVNSEPPVVYTMQ